MKQYPLIGISIIAVIILILASMTNVVGYQSVQSSNKQTINEAVNQRELLFQTIFDISNNKEIQRIILKSQMSQGIFPTTEFPVVTKNQIRQMYIIGLVLSKFISKSKIQSMVHKYQVINPYLQKEISAFIKKDANLREEISHLTKLNYLLNTSFSELTEFLIWIILSVIFFILFLVSGFVLFVSFSIALVFVTIEKYTGVWMLSDIMSLILVFSMIISVNVFAISFYSVYTLSSYIINFILFYWHHLEVQFHVQLTD
jgi:hypothetical protein